MSPEVPIATLQALLRNGPPLRLAILFGSGARGTLRPGSDLDVGILPGEPELTWTQETALQAELERACQRRVDLVRLDQASTLLRGQAARDGKLLMEAREGEFVRFQVAATSEYLDFLPAYDVAAERFRQRLAGLTGGGSL